MAELFGRDPRPGSQPYQPLPTCPRGPPGIGGQAKARGAERKGFEGAETEAEHGGRGREAAPPSFEPWSFDAGGAETSPLPETPGQTDKHRWRERLRCFIYGPGDRPSPVSESLIYRAEETSHPLATAFPPSCDWGSARL